MTTVFHISSHVFHMLLLRTGCAIRQSGLAARSRPVSRCSSIGVAAWAMHKHRGPPGGWICSEAESASILLSGDLAWARVLHLFSLLNGGNRSVVRMRLICIDGITANDFGNRRSLIGAVHNNLRTMPGAQQIGLNDRVRGAASGE